MAIQKAKAHLAELESSDVEDDEADDVVEVEEDDYQDAEEDSAYMIRELDDDEYKNINNGTMSPAIRCFYVANHNPTRCNKKES